MFPFVSPLDEIFGLHICGFFCAQSSAIVKLQGRINLCCVMMKNELNKIKLKLGRNKKKKKSYEFVYETSFLFLKTLV